MRFRKPKTEPQTEPQKCSKRPLMASVGPFAVTGPVEVGEHVYCPAFEGSAQRFEFRERGWKAGAEGVNYGIISLLAWDRSGCR